MTTTSVTSGRVSSGTVTSGNIEIVFAGGITSGLIVSAGGQEVVSSGGLASTTILRGGTETVVAGGVTSKTVISSGGVLVNSGTATTTTVFTGGIFTNYGTAAATTISTGAAFNEFGSDTGTIVTSGGSAIIHGSSTSMTVAQNGTLTVNSGATVNHTNLQAGSSTVQLGGVALATTVSLGATETVQFGGLTIGSIVSGHEVVAGVTSAATVYGNADETISSGGVAFGTILSGGALKELSGATASNTVINANGIATVSAGATATGTSITTGGYEDNFGTTNNEIVGSGGSATVENGGVAVHPTIDGGILDLGIGSVVSGTIDFTGIGGTLQIDSTVMPTNVISGLILGDTLDLRAISYVSGQTSYSVSADQLTVSAGGLTYSLNVAGAGTDAFTLSDDGNGGLDIVPCFMAGTRVLTDRGEVAVEELVAGEMVVTDRGLFRPIRWVGRQTVSMRFADPLRVAPIRIRRGALANGIPSRDLLISPDHALLLDNMLIQAGALVNGVSIRHETDVPQSFVYYHVELQDHSLILAEGVAAETFIDNVDRMAFDNWSEHQALGLDAEPIEEMAYPRAKAYRQVPVSLRNRLSDRADRLFGKGLAAVA